ERRVREGDCARRRLEPEGRRRIVDLVQGGGVVLRTTCVVLMCLAAFGACTTKQKATVKPKATHAFDPNKLRREASRLQKSRLVIDATGDATVHYAADTDLRIVTFDPGASYQAQRLLSVGMEQF